jgi:hypothetical protein
MSSDEANDAAFRERLLSDPRLSPVLSDPARFRAQVLLTEVVETSGAGTEACPSRGHTRLRRHAFRADAEYFYPASTVKLFGAIAACVALRELAQAHPGLDKDTPLAFGACPREDASKDETETESVVHANLYRFSTRDFGSFHNVKITSRRAPSPRARRGGLDDGHVARVVDARAPSPFCAFLIKQCSQFLGFWVFRVALHAHAMRAFASSLWL